MDVTKLPQELVQALVRGEIIADEMLDQEAERWFQVFRKSASEDSSPDIVLALDSRKAELIEYFKEQLLGLSTGNVYSTDK